MPSALPLCKACCLSDFSHAALAAAARTMMPHEVYRFGEGWPASHPYRKDWEVAMAALALEEAGALRPDAEVLGVGAGNEPTLFWLTTTVGRVFASDLYLSEGWEESASAEMMLNPGLSWPGRWDKRRLVVQHLDGRDLHHPDGCFDAVFSSSSFEHFGDIDDVREAVVESVRVLKPGGVLSVSTELLLSGTGRGLPGSLLFTPEEVLEVFVEGLPVEPIGPIDLSVDEATLDTVWPFEDFAADVRAHVAANGAIRFHRLRWRHLPHVVLSWQGLTWTSMHLALRRVR